MLYNKTNAAFHVYIPSAVPCAMKNDLLRKFSTLFITLVFCNNSDMQSTLDRIDLRETNTTTTIINKPVVFVAGAARSHSPISAVYSVQFQIY